MSAHTPLLQRAPIPIALTAAAAVLLAALVAVPSVGIASASPSVAPAPVTAQSGTWSFGNVSLVGVHGADDQGGFSGSASYGFVTNITTTNTSATTIEVFAQATIGISLSLQYCRPQCSSPVQTTEFTYGAWQTEDAWTNLTTVANVTETSANSVTPVSVNALGILNSSSRVRAGTHETLIDTHSAPSNETLVSSLIASYGYESNSSVAFTPALGILPTGAVAAGDTWTASALYQASAQWEAQWSVNVTNPRVGSAIFNGSYGRSPSGTGVVTIFGIAGISGIRVASAPLLAIGYTLNDDRLALGPGFSIAWAAPGAFGEGLPGDTPWDSNEAVGANVVLRSLDALPTPGNAERLQSSAFDYSLTFLDPNNGNGVNDTVPASQVSGAPMTSGQAGTTASCLQSGSACAVVSSPGGGGGLGGNATGLLVIGSAAILVVLVAAVVVTRQRRVPPPQYPNAGLYPPGQPIAPPGEPPSEPKSPGRPPSGPADDPLDQLW